MLKEIQAHHFSSWYLCSDKCASVGRLNRIIRMKQFVVLLCLLPLSMCSAEAGANADADAEADANPGYGRYYGHGGHRGYGYPYAYGKGYGHYAPRCQVTYEIVTSQECHAVLETVCHTEHVTNYVVEHEKQCATHSVPECHTVVKQVPEQQCATHAEQQCHHEEQCTNQYQTVEVKYSGEAHYPEYHSGGHRGHV